MTVTGSRSTMASAKSIVADVGRVGEGGAAAAELASRAEGLAHLADLARRSSSTAAVSEPSSASISPFSVVSSSSSRLQLHLLELAQRAQPHVEDRFGLELGQLEARISSAFGSSSSRMMRITSSRSR